MGRVESDVTGAPYSTRIPVSVRGPIKKTESKRRTAGNYNYCVLDSRWDRAVSQTRQPQIDRHQAQCQQMLSTI